MADEKFLVTGAYGCIGAWVLRCLAEEGVGTVATDLSPDDHRLRLLLGEAERSRIEFRSLDVTDRQSVSRLFAETGVTHVIHLAGLQVPFCKADPALGSRVNVTGTIHILEAAAQSASQIRGVAYASSVAVFGPPERYPMVPVPDDAPFHPNTLYGVYKVSNEQAARVYWNDRGLGSVGLRPYIVYGVGRDQGLTSDLAKAILAAVAGQPFQIQFGGQVALQYTEDVAKMFIQAARACPAGAAACNLRNDVMDVATFVAELVRQFPQARIRHKAEAPLPFPADLDDSGLRKVLGTVPHTPLPTAVQRTAERFEELLSRGMVTADSL